MEEEEEELYLYINTLWLQNRRDVHYIWDCSILHNDRNTTVKRQVICYLLFIE